MPVELLELAAIGEKQALRPDIDYTELVGPVSLLLRSEDEAREVTHEALNSLFPYREIFPQEWQRIQDSIGSFDLSTGTAHIGWQIGETPLYTSFSFERKQSRLHRPAWVLSISPPILSQAVELREGLAGLYKDALLPNGVSLFLRFKTPKEVERYLSLVQADQFLQEDLTYELARGLDKATTDNGGATQHPYSIEFSDKFPSMDPDFVSYPEIQLTADVNPLAVELGGNIEAYVKLRAGAALKREPDGNYSGTATLPTTVTLYVMPWEKAKMSTSPEVQAQIYRAGSTLAFCDRDYLQREFSPQTRHFNNSIAFR